MDESGVMLATQIAPTTYVAADDTAIATSILLLLLTTARAEDQTLIRLTPEELESLVDR